jgi:hypothetical protein
VHPVEDHQRLSAHDDGRPEDPGSLYLLGESLEAPGDSLFVEKQLIDLDKGDIESDPVAINRI